MDMKFYYGVFVGVAPRSNESIALTHEGSVNVRTVRRLTADKRWGNEFMATVKGVPWDKNATAGDEIEGDIIPVRRDEAPERPPPIEEEPTLPRRAHIRKKDVEQHGVTCGCPGCTAIRRGSKAQARSEACEARVVPLIGQTPEGASRLRHADARINEAIAARIRDKNAENNCGCRTSCE
jgi:hypothetical protein